MHTPRWVRGPVLLAAATVLAALLAPGSAARSAAAVRAGPIPLVLDIAWSDAPTVQAFERIVSLYNRSHPATHWSVVPNVPNEKLLTQIAAGRSPDLAMLWSAEFVGTDAANGLALGLDPFVRASHFDLRAILPAAVAAGTLRNDGRLYALPFFEDTYMVYYNTAMWARAGLRGPPATLEAMVEDARRLTTYRNGAITTLGWDPGDLYGAQNWFGQGLFGCPFANAAGTRIEVATPPCIEALRFLLAAYRQLGGLQAVRLFNSAFSRTFGSPLDPFTDGHEGMYLAGEYESAYIQRYNPRLQFGVFPMPPPAHHPEMRGYGTEGGNPLIIPRGTHDPVAAWGLLSWLVTSGMWEAVRHGYVGDEEAMPTLLAILEKPALAPSAHMAAFWTWYRSSPNIRPWPCILVAHEYADLLTTEIGAMLAGQLTPEQAMQAVQDQMTDRLHQALVAWHA